MSGKNVSLRALPDVSPDISAGISHNALENPEYEVLQKQIYDVTDDYTNIIVEQDLDQIITRRNALRTLALLPIQVCGLAKLSQALRHPAEDILVQCAAGIAACWYFKKGKELTLANDALGMYIPTLQALTHSAARYKKAAAALLVQCYILKATLARHIVTNENAVQCLQQAIHYSDISGDILLRILSWRTLAATHLYANAINLALPCFEKAKQLLETHKGKSNLNATSIKSNVVNKAAPPIPLLVHSYVYAGLANIQAQMGMKESAETSLALAHTTFDAQHGQKAPVWIDHSEPNLLLNDGMTHYHLSQTTANTKEHQQFSEAALKAFSLMDNLVSDTGKSEMIRAESLLNRSMAEVNKESSRSMEYVIAHWEQGLQGAIDLHSEQWFREARTIYTMMRSAWPGEQKVKDLRTKIVHW